MADRHIRLNERAIPYLEKWKNDIKRIMNVETSNSKAIELLLCNPKIVILPRGKKKRKMEIHNLY